MHRCENAHIRAEKDIVSDRDGRAVDTGEIEIRENIVTEICEFAVIADHRAEHEEVLSRMRKDLPQNTVSVLIFFRQAAEFPAQIMRPGSLLRQTVFRRIVKPAGKHFFLFVSVFFIHFVKLL